MSYKYKPVQREIDEVYLEISQDMALDELGGRRRKVYYRSRTKRIKENMILGKPGFSIEHWKLITPTPSTDDTKREFSEEGIGLVKLGDLEMRVDRNALSRKTIEESEFYINDDPDAPPPTIENNANYDLIEGGVQEGGADTRQRYKSFWIVTLRRRQVND